MHKILVTGGNGQLGQAIVMAAQGSNSKYIALSRSEADICNYEMMDSLLSVQHFDIVINCAAYTNVDGAEDNLDEAQRINTEGVATLARVCNRHNARLVHISTDYVFGGDEQRIMPYAECDTPHPINNYGRTKLAGEQEALKLPDAIVIRTAWLYSPWGKNFVRTILRLACELGELRVINDQRGTPTSALSLARTIVSLIESEKIDEMSGIYHYTNRGETSWYDFAQRIVELAGVECTIEPCSTAERPSKASRPRYSVLDCQRISQICGTITEWQEALAECIELINKEDE